MFVQTPSRKGCLAKAPFSKHFILPHHQNNYGKGALTGHPFRRTTKTFFGAQKNGRIRIDFV